MLELVWNKYSVEKRASENTEFVKCSPLERILTVVVPVIWTFCKFVVALAPSAEYSLMRKVPADAVTLPLADAVPICLRRSVKRPVVEKERRSTALFAKVEGPWVKVKIVATKPSTLE
jgi:hypothetical protein